MTPNESGSPTRFDFDFRPDYWNPDSPRTVILGNVTGEMRRRFLERLIEGDPRMAIFIDDEAREDHLSPQRRMAQGRIHPTGLGGEFLPEYLPGEVEIARIVLESVTMDVVSIRAHRRDGLIHYRVVTEYPENEGEYVAWLPKESQKPLKFGELIAFIDSFEEPAMPRPNQFIEALRDTCYDEWGMDLHRAADFVRVESFFYPQLEEFYSELRADEWFEKKRQESLEPCPDCGETYDPNEDHGCSEQLIRLEREAKQAEEEASQVEVFEALVSPFKEAIEKVFEDWRCVDPGDFGAAGMGRLAAQARARGLRGFLREYVARKGGMPVGTQTIQWRFMGLETRTFAADLDTLHARAEEARAHLERERRARVVKDAERKKALREALIGAPDIVVTLHVIQDWFKTPEHNLEKQAARRGPVTPHSHEQKTHCLEMFVLHRVIEGEPLPNGVHTVTWATDEGQAVHFPVDFDAIGEEGRRRRDG